MDYRVRTRSLAQDERIDFAQWLLDNIHHPIGVYDSGEKPVEFSVRMLAQWVTREVAMQRPALRYEILFSNNEEATLFRIMWGE